MTNFSTPAEMPPMTTRDFWVTASIIYYQDQRGTDRKLVGKIIEIDGDKLWLENTHRHTGELWRGCINCANCKIGIISTIQGWSGKEDNMA